MTTPSTSTPAGPARLVLALVVLAGFADAVSFRQFQKLYVSFMSGNTTALGVAVAGGGWAAAGWLAAVIGTFVGGVMLAGWLRRRSARPTGAVLAVVAGLLALAAVGPGNWHGPALLLTLGMGLLATAVRQAGAGALNVGYVTGTLVRIGTGLADRLSGQPWPAGWGRQALDWLALAAGAVLGAFAWQHLALRALLPAAAYALGLAALAYHRRL